MAHHAVKSFSTLTDAERFVAGENPAQNGNNGTSPPAKFYAVKNGRTPGIYTDWPSAQEQITGWQKPKHRCFTTRVEAQKFLDEDESRAAENLNTFDGDGHSPLTWVASDGPPELDLQPFTQKKVKKNANGIKSAMIEFNEVDYEPGTGPLPPDAEDGFDPNLILDPQSGILKYKTQEERQNTKLKLSTGVQTDPIRIHTDGSSLGNGKAGAFAGVGVYFGPGDKRYAATRVDEMEITLILCFRNISETLPGSRQTNQRAELTAVLRALEIVPRNRNVVTITDSRYAIDCVTSWYVNWRKNGWKTSAGKAVENKDIIENILAKIDERDRLNVQTSFEWIKGHANHPGNVEADKLAVEGAKMGPES